METVPRDRMGWQEGCRLGSIVKQVSPPTPAPSSLYTVAVLLYRKRIYICKVCCKMREKKKTMSTKKKSAKEKNPNTCVLWVFTGDGGSGLHLGDCG